MDLHQHYEPQQAMEVACWPLTVFGVLWFCSMCSASRPEYFWVHCFVCICSYVSQSKRKHDTIGYTQVEPTCAVMEPLCFLGQPAICTFQTAHPFCASLVGRVTLPAEGELRRRPVGTSATDLMWLRHVCWGTSTLLPPVTSSNGDQRTGTEC